MGAREQHFVTFVSPGTLFDEQTRRPIENWDPPMAARMSRDIVERYDAKPYGFYFSTSLVHDPIPDGRGGVLDVEEREIARSGHYFIGGSIRTYDDVSQSATLPANSQRDERILLSNMRGNDWPFIITNTNSYRITKPFDERDVVVDAAGNVVERGDDRGRKIYRADWTERKARGEF